MTWPPAPRRHWGQRAPGPIPRPTRETLAVTKGWSVEQTLILLIALALIALILVPGGLLSRRLDRRKTMTAPTSR